MLIWNPSAEGDAGGGGYAPPRGFLDGIERARLVVAERNDLLNRFRMDLVAPTTDAVLLLDDDDPVPKPATVARLYEAQGNVRNGCQSHSIARTRIGSIQ